MKHKYANINFTPKDINKENKSLRAVFSTSDVDRHGEVVDQKSWLLDDFLKNPVVLYGHDHSQPPIGKVIGLGYNEDGNLEGEIKFAADEYPFANVIWNLYREGFMKAFSVGFSAGVVDIVNNQVILKNNTLYEISTVAVPANAFALAKAKGFDTSALEEKMIADVKAINEKKKCEHCEKEVEAEKECPCKVAKVEDLAAEIAVEEPIVETPAAPVVETPVATQETPSEEGPADAIVEETQADAIPAEDEEVEKSIGDIISSAKEGRVLSKKNRKVLEDALVAIQALLEQDNKEDGNKSLTEEEKMAAFIKVETPSIKLSVSNKTQNKAGLINKAIRALLDEKRKTLQK